MHVQTQIIASEMEDLREQHAERGMVDLFRNATFVSLIRQYGLEEHVVVSTPKGKTLTIKASDVYTARHKFFARFDLNLQSCRLTISGDVFGELFWNWLLHEYSPRYRFITSEEQQRWLKQVVALVVARHLMETKYALYLQGEESFADGWACGAICHLQELASQPENAARTIHHIVKDPVQQTVLIEQFYQQADERMKRHQFVLPEPLPPLPQGAVLPFALLMQPKEERDA